MINVRRVASYCMAIALVSFSMFSCTQDESITPENEISQDVLAAIENLGLSTDGMIVGLVDHNMIDDVPAVPGVILENDIRFTMDELNLLSNAAQSQSVVTPTGEQYRTNALVSQGRTISVIGFTGSGFALTSRMRTGLQRAVDNYNRLNISLRFTLRFAASTNADMVVFNNGAAGGGGSAGFPSGGLPNKFIQINAGTNSFSADVNEHVITHEMGHSIGFRHTDFFNRSLSCGTGGNEGQAGVGAILIPGTPSGNDVNSIMRACFNSGVDGEFGANDIRALEFLY